MGSGVIDPGLGSGTEQLGWTAPDGIDVPRCGRQDLDQGSRPQ
jgi:hypothetical protein